MAMVVEAATFTGLRRARARRGLGLAIAGWLAILNCSQAPGQTWDGTLPRPEVQNVVQSPAAPVPIQRCGFAEPPPSKEEGGGEEAPPTPEISDLGAMAGGAEGPAAALPTLQGDTTWGGRPAYPHVIAPALVATPYGLPILNNNVDHLVFSGGIPPNFIVDSNSLPQSLKTADLVLGSLGFPVAPNTFVPFSAMLLSSPIIGFNMINWAENGCVLPQDRVFFDYRHFDAVGALEIVDLYGPDPANGHPDAYYHQQEYRPLSVDRYVLGFERTFGHGLWSVECRLPFQGQTASTQTFYPGAPIENRLEIGNAGLAVKRYLFKGDRLNVTGGLGMQLPTALDTNFNYQSHLLLTWNNLTADFHEYLQVRQSNETIWLNPFLGVSYTQDRLFTQGMFQVCVPLNPSTATLHTSIPDGNISLYGIPLFDFSEYPINQTTDISMAFESLIRVNVDLGYWVYQNPDGLINSCAAVIEVNDTNTLGNAYSANVVNLGPQLVVNLLKTEVDLGLLVPVTGDQAYKSEFVCRVNRRF